MTAGVFGSGGPHGARVWWPAGLERLSPAERAEALERGRWRDGDAIVTRDGRRLTACVQDGDEVCGSPAYCARFGCRL